MNLREELLNDPLSRGYAGMTDTAAHTDLTDTSLRPLPDLDILSGAQIYEALDRTEFLALTAGQQEEVKIILTLGDRIDISAGSKARATMLALFDAVSTTRANLLAIVQNRTTSRALELGLGDITVDDVTAARSTQP